MSHLLKYTEWESISGWHCGDVSDLAHGSNYWWLPARMLNLSLTDYILMLINDFHAINFKYYKDTNLLLWHWKNYNDCHKFCLWINRKAREKKFFIC